jgi:hypothetical protein
VLQFSIDGGQNTIRISDPARSLQSDELGLDQLLANHFVDRQEDEENRCE